MNPAVHFLSSVMGIAVLFIAAPTLLANGSLDSQASHDTHLEPVVAVSNCQNQ